MTFNYVRLPNELTGTPPADARKATMHGLLLSGNKADMQRYCDAALNSFESSRFRFSVVSNKVMVTSIYVDEMRSLDPLERNNGSVVEEDIAFWAIVRCVSISGSAFDRLMLLPFFMFVNNGPAMASGREIYGYPKCVSQITRHYADAHRAEVDISTVHFAEYSPDSRAQNSPIVSIACDGAMAVEKSTSSLAEVAAQFVSLFEPELHAGIASDPFPNLGMPQVTHRQLRDPTRAGTASLRDVLLVMPRAGSVSAAGPLPQGLTVRIEKSASHDLIGMMGLKPDNAVEIGAWLSFNFVAGWAERLI